MKLYKNEIIQNDKTRITESIMSVRVGYKNPSENQRLASGGLPSGDNWWSQRTDFSIPSSHVKWIFSCSPLNTSFVLEKKIKRLPENPER